MVFGKVYEINFVTREKSVYPVVYINRDFLVCKQNGTNRPRIFSRDETAFNGGIYTVDLEVIKKKYDSHLNRTWIYVPHGVKEDFSVFLYSQPA